MRFYLSGNLIRFSSYRREIEVEAATVYDGINALVARYPGLRSVLLDGDSEVRRLHRLFLNGEPLAVEDVRASVDADADISILTAIAGG